MLNDRSIGAQTGDAETKTKKRKRSEQWLHLGFDISVFSNTNLLDTQHFEYNKPAKKSIMGQGESRVCSFSVSEEENKKQSADDVRAKAQAEIQERKEVSKKVETMKSKYKRVFKAFDSGAYHTIPYSRYICSSVAVGE